MPPGVKGWLFIPLAFLVVAVGFSAEQKGFSAARSAIRPEAATREAVVPANPEFDACRTATRMIVNYRFKSLPAGLQGRPPLLLLTSAKSAGSRYPPLTVITDVWKRSGRVNQSRGLGVAPWRVLVSVWGAGGRSPTIKRPLPPCR
jgi:hypothetical protein